MVKYGRQRNHILQDLTGLEIWISMKGSKTKNRLETPENRFAKKAVLTSLIKKPKSHHYWEQDNTASSNTEVNSHCKLIKRRHFNASSWPNLCPLRTSEKYMYVGLQYSVETNKRQKPPSEISWDGFPRFKKQGQQLKGCINVQHLLIFNDTVP